MEFDSLVAWFSGPIQIAFLDLVLGADNAVIIALVCRTLPRRQRTNVMIVGTGAAMLLRLVLTALTGALMFVPLLRLAGALVLVLIAVTLTEDVDVAEGAGDADDDAGPADAVDAQAASEAFWDAILLVVLADGVMSLDNTVALAAVAKGDVLFLILGLALSVPTLVFGSWLLTELLGTTPLLTRSAMAVLGWVAGDMAVSDPLIADWIRTEAPALVYGVPLAAVIFVLLQGGRRTPAIAAAGSPTATVDTDADRTPIRPDRPRAELLLAGEAAANLPIADAPSPGGAPPGPEVNVLRPEVVAVASTVADASRPAAAAAADAPTATASQTPIASAPPDPPGVTAEAEHPQPGNDLPAGAVDPLAETTDAGIAGDPDAGANSRWREERLLLYGLFGLLIVAAILITVAIFVGGDAQF